MHIWNRLCQIDDPLSRTDKQHIYHLDPLDYELRGSPLGLPRLKNDFMPQNQAISPQHRHEMVGMMQRSPSILMDTESVPLGSQSITPRVPLDPFGFLDEELVSQMHE
jgi:hypothetical protein